VREVEPGQRGADGGRIHVVEHVQAGMSTALFLRELVPPGRAQRRTQGDGPQCRPANAEQQHVVEPPPDLLRHRERLLEQRRVGGQGEKSEIVRARMHGGVRAREPLGRRGELLLGDAGAMRQRAGHHVGEIE